MASGNQPPRKTRRKSLGLIQALESKCLLSQVSSGLTKIKNAYVFNKELLEKYGNEHMDIEYMSLQEVDKLEEFTSKLEKEGKQCTGLIFRHGGAIEHADPYLKIGGEWYNGNNEYGYLRKMANPPPNPFMRYINSKGQLRKGISITDCIFFYCDTSVISEERVGKNVSGVPTFGQTDGSCGADSVQTILMYADGFYEWFNQHMYEDLKTHHFQTSEKFTHYGMKGRIPENLNEETRDKLENELEEEIKRLLEVYDDKDNEHLLRFLIIMFIRFYSYETMPPEARNYNIALNSSIVNTNIIKEKTLSRLFRYIRENKTDEIISYFTSGEHIDINTGTPEGFKVPNTAGGFTMLNIGFTLLMYASVKGSIELVNELLKLGANINTQASNGITALHTACSSKKIPMIHFLLSSGSTLNNKIKDDMEKFTPEIREILKSKFENLRGGRLSIRTRKTKLKCHPPHKRHK